MQFTNVVQKHPPFRSPYEGVNSLKARERMEETSDLTTYAGFQAGGRRGPAFVVGSPEA